MEQMGRLFVQYLLQSRFIATLRVVDGGIRCAAARYNNKKKNRNRNIIHKRADREENLQIFTLKMR